MEKTKTPKQIIQSYLEERAKNDPLFASVYAKPNKNINECFDYILSEAKKRGNAVCMSDDEVFSLAVHYYDEDDIKVSKQTNYKAVTSQAPKSDVGAAPQKETGRSEKTNSRRKGKKNESSSLQFSLFEGL
ncbi:PcfK-like family protein [Phocaeicola vulgatus]|uniref:PcfK-like family protein n=1 Tax=Phocaeicola vulgatus TaxID=821 RepID=UPI0034A33331